jgi:hypothetical protein
VVPSSPFSSIILFLRPHFRSGCVSFCSLKIRSENTTNRQDEFVQLQKDHGRAAGQGKNPEILKFLKNFTKLQISNLNLFFSE